MQGEERAYLAKMFYLAGKSSLPLPYGGESVDYIQDFLCRVESVQYSEGMLS
jgi:hypothetical protein